MKAQRGNMGFSLTCITYGMEVADGEVDGGLSSRSLLEVPSV